MRHLKPFIAGCILAASAGLQSCDSNDNNTYISMQPTALVTVCPQPDESVMFQLDEETTLRPTNMKKSPYGKKTVRALINYVYADDATNSPMRDVKVNWIDSIRTKLPVNNLGSIENGIRYGNDPIEIVDDWVTVGEDGYLTLRVRTIWGEGSRRHTLDMVHGVNPDNPMEFELHHNANGDNSGRPGDALIAFNLNEFMDGQTNPVKITVKWKSFSGEKSAEFDLSYRKEPIENPQQTARIQRYFQ